MTTLLMGQIAAFLIGIISSVAASFLYSVVGNRFESHFSFNRVVSLILDLANKVQNDNFHPDFVIAIDRNSTITGGILAGHFGLKTVFSVATENIRHEDGSRTIEIAEGYAPTDPVFVSSKVLVYICFNDSGTSLQTVYQHLMSIGCAASSVRTAALFTSSSPRFMPKYFVKKVGINLRTPINELMPKMPWVTRSWKHVFGSERLRD